MSDSAGTSAPEPSVKSQTVSDQQRKGLALCLSGGGYRAVLFHLGALRRLNELRILSRVDTFSSVSGGSILAALLLDSVRPWPRPGERVDQFDQFAARVRDFTRKNIRTLWAFERALPWNWFDSTIGVRALARRYGREIDDRPLARLPERPRFVFCATDMSFGVNWVCERARIGDYQAGYVSPPPDSWTVSRAVAASSCFPPVFSPLPIDLDPAQLVGGRAQHRSDREELVNRLRLSDGGVYDNMALEPVWKSDKGGATQPAHGRQPPEPRTVLVSDGGATFDFRPDRGFPSRLGRYLAVQSNQAGAVRKRALIDSFERKEMRGAYWGLGSKLSSYKRPDTYSERVVDQIISEVRTDLDCFSRAEQAVLENHGYLLADAAIARHLPELPTKADPSPPHPDYLVDAKVEKALANSSKRKLRGRWRVWPGN